VSKYAAFIAPYVSTTAGDVDQNGIIDISDVLMVIDFILGHRTPTDQERNAANIDAAGSDIDGADLTAIIDLIFGE